MGLYCIAIIRPTSVRDRILFVINDKSGSSRMPLGDYIFLRLIGQGTYGEASLVKSKVDSRQVGVFMSHPAAITKRLHYLVERFFSTISGLLQIWSFGRKLWKGWGNKGREVIARQFVR